MGFTTGFLSGLTLTLSLTYVSLAAHARNRAHQASILRTQTDTLNTLVDPTLREQQQDALQRQFRIPREEYAGVGEALKDRWNARLASEVRRLQETDWREVRERCERGALRLWDSLRSTGE